MSRGSRNPGTSDADCAMACAAPGISAISAARIRAATWISAIRCDAPPGAGWSSADVVKIAGPQKNDAGRERPGSGFCHFTHQFAVLKAAAALGARARNRLAAL